MSMDARESWPLAYQRIRSSSGEWIGWGEPPALDDALLSLGRVARFAGHTSRYWTVLQHSMVAYLIAREYQREAPELARDLPDLPLQCLLHDWAETLTGDVPTPFKPPEWQLLERACAERAGRRYGLVLWWGDVVWEAVHQVDKAALYAEAALLYQVRPDWPAPSRMELSAVETVLRVPHGPDVGALHRMVGDIINGAKQ